MPTDLGDLYPLSIQIFDAQGQPANAGNVTLTVTLPDGTLNEVGVIPPSTSTGVYNYDYETTHVGRHIARWVATGQNASAHTNTFYVNPTDTGEFISLAQFRTFIKKNHNRDDETIRTFISGSCAVINDRMGQVAPMTFTEDVQTRNNYARLSRTPIMAVLSVERLPGLVSVPEANMVTGTKGWRFNPVSDSHTPLYVGGSGWYRISYRAGYEDIPQNFILAALELTKHLWQTSQQNPGGGRPPISTDDNVVINGISYAMPYNVRQLLGLDKRPRTEIFVG